MKAILNIKKLKKHFPVKNAWGTDIALVKALDGVDLEIESGKTFGIVGESGCGKTTLMRTLLRLVEPTSGSVAFSDDISSKISSEKRTTLISTIKKLSENKYYKFFEFILSPLTEFIEMTIIFGAKKLHDVINSKNLLRQTFFLNSFLSALNFYLADDFTLQILSGISFAFSLGASIFWPELSDELEEKFSVNTLEGLKPEELRLFRRQIGVVFQDPMGALNPRMIIKDIVSEPLVIHGKTDNIRNRVIELLENVGLGEEHLYRYPHEFSGGQRQRIVIARALALDPKILVLDEPTSALDVSVQAQILNLLNDLQKKYDLTYIFISHDLSVIEYMCDRLAVMYLGKVVEEADTEDLFSNPQHPYTKALLSATPSFDKSKEKIMILGDVPSPITYLDESKAKLATEMTEQEKLEIKSIEGKGIDYIVRSSLNEVVPLVQISNGHYARVK